MPSKVQPIMYIRQVTSQYSSARPTATAEWDSQPERHVVLGIPEGVGGEAEGEDA